MYSSINKCLEIIILAVIGSVVESLMSLLGFIERYSSHLTRVSGL